MILLKNLKEKRYIFVSRISTLTPCHINLTDFPKVTFEVV